MKKLFTKITLLLTCVLGLTCLAPVSVFAADPCDSSLPPSVREANGCKGESSDSSLPVLIKNILLAIIGAVGLVAVIFTIIGGVNYMTSSGDAGKTEKAKKTILYALIGLAVCVLSFAIVNFTVNNIIKSSSTPAAEDSGEDGD